MERRDKINYYLDLAEMVSQRGTCLRKQYGAVIVKNDEVVSTGYVGAPRGRANCIDLGYCIREKMQIAAKGKVDAVFLSDLADTLEGHIRFEERIMFNFIQQQLSDVQLAKIAEIHKEKPTDLDTGWQDHFWEIKK